MSQNLSPEIHGTIRGKYECLTETGENRFAVRNARVGVSGKVVDAVSYKAEIDLSDEGNIKMLDAWVRLSPLVGLDFTLGQMRVPFSIDAHRSPHLRYFANRSFIAKQAGNVRDVGAMVTYKANGASPFIFQAGLFNGSGLTDQKDYWTRSLNYALKAQVFLTHGYSVTLSMTRTKPGPSTIMTYDIGAYLHKHNWHVEAEFLQKHYSDNTFPNAYAIDVFANYDIKIRRTKSLLKKVSPLVRYDYLSDHSDGKSFDDTDRLNLDDSERHRLTAGLTFSLAAPFVADLRVNYEKYFYNKGVIANYTEKDKIVFELITHF